MKTPGRGDAFAGGGTEGTKVLARAASRVDCVLNGVIESLWRAQWRYCCRRAPLLLRLRCTAGAAERRAGTRRAGRVCRGWDGLLDIIDAETGTDGEAESSMTAQADQESHSFQAEVVQILDLMVHSLYSNKEIFLRELISNASDAIDRLRFEAYSDAGLRDTEDPLQIRVSFDTAARTITVSDNGLGMSRAEVIEHIGTIAKSGTKEFLGALTGDQRKDASLIGQFGVGFYSAFVVADRVTLTTRRAGLPAADA